MTLNMAALLADPAMQRIIKQNTRVYDRMTATQNRFVEAVEAYVHEDVGSATDSNGDTERELFSACGKVWSDGGKIPALYWNDVDDAIGNPLDINEWRVRGSTFAGAARRIRWWLTNRREGRLK